MPAPRPTPVPAVAGLVAGKKPRQASAALVADDALLDAYQDALDTWQHTVTAQRVTRVTRIREALTLGRDEATAVGDADAADDHAISAARARLDEARARLDEATLVFTFRSLGRSRFRELRDEHPPTAEDIDQAVAEAGPGARPAWHPATFLPALIQESCVTPTLTDADVASMFESDAWTDAELGVLTGAALDVHLTATQPPPAVGD